MIAPLLALLALAVPQDAPARTVKGRVQVRPGGPRVEAEIPVHAAPVDPRMLPADEVELDDDELVLGVVHDGAAVAFPIRYLAMYEVVNGIAGKRPIAPTW